MKQPPVPEATLNDLLLWLLRRRKRLRVVGESMASTLNARDLVLVDTRAYLNGPPVPGEIVVAVHPSQPELRIIKRVDHITEEGKVYLVSDNPHAGTDSRTFGAIPHERMIGRVVCRVG